MDVEAGEKYFLPAFLCMKGVGRVIRAPCVYFSYKLEEFHFRRRKN